MDRMLRIRKPDGQIVEMSPERWARCRNRRQCAQWQVVPPKAPVPVVLPSARARVVHVSPWGLTVGGMQRMIDLWCRRDGHRWDVHIVSQGPRGPFGFKNATVHAPVHASEVDQLLASLQPDLLVHHAAHLTYGRYDRCPCIWMVHGMAPLREPAPDWCQPVAVFSNLDSPEIHPSWRQRPLRALPLGVDLEVLHPRRLVCGIVGRLSPEKVPPAFVECLRTWTPGPWTIRFIGEGITNAHQPWVKKRLAGLDWVEFAGDVPPDQIPATLRALDAVLVPTDRAWGETGCYSAVEALACGVPVVGRDVDGLRASCREGALYGESDEDLLRRLRELDDPTRRWELGRLGRQVAQSHHDLAAHVAVHSQTFTDALPVTVSVLTSVYNNTACHLNAFWQSLGAQTLRAWELVLVDDGSTEAETIAALDHLAADPRVRLVRLPRNRGLPVALNTGLHQCRAELVARMDGDDIMLAERLARQVDYLRAHPEVDILGAQIEVFEDTTGQVGRRTAHAAVVTKELIDEQARARNIWFLNHPTVMFRKAALERIGGYPERHRFAEDLDCWLHAFRAGLTIHNLPDVLVRYRRHAAQIGSHAETIKARVAIVRKLMAEWLHLATFDQCPPPSAALSGDQAALSLGKTSTG